MFIPAMKKDGQDGYTFCPKCAAMWGIILLAIGATAWYLYKKRNG